MLARDLAEGSSNMTPTMLAVANIKSSGKRVLNIDLTLPTTQRVF